MKEELKEYPGWSIETLPPEGDRPATVYVWEGEKRYARPLTDPNLARAEKMAINTVRNTIRDRELKKLERRKKAAEPDRGELDLFVKQMPPTTSTAVPDDYSDRIKRARGRLALTQQALADRLGVSFATVNRWENAQTKPSRFYWTQIENVLYGRDCDGHPHIEAILWDNRTHRLPSYSPVPQEQEVVEGDGQEVDDVTDVEAAYRAMDVAQLNLSQANSQFDNAYRRLRWAQDKDRRRQEAAKWRDKGFRRGVRLKDNLGDLWDVVSDPSTSYASPLDAIVVKAYRLRSGEREYTELRLNGDLTFEIVPKDG